MANNTITHIEIPAPDQAAAIRFYSSLFNWTCEVVAENSYAFFRIGDTNAGGGFDASLTPAGEKTAVQMVIDVDDIETTLTAIQKAGGEIVLGETTIEGGHGFYAAFKDPNGNYMQIHGNK